MGNIKITVKQDEIIFQQEDKRLEISPNEDIMITSYPRSGNTWVRFLLANLITNSDHSIDFPAMEKLVPDLHEPSRWDNLLERPPTGRLIKSHIPSYVSFARFKRVIYIVRDGRDVKVSQYHYYCPHDLQLTFLEFLQFNIWPGLWCKHVESWLDRANNISFLLVRYEDMLIQPEEQLERMAKFAGLPTDKQRIARAVKHSKFESLQKIDPKKIDSRYKGSDFKFFRKGNSGQWVRYFGPEHKAVFQPHANPVLLRLGYIDGPDW